MWELHWPGQGAHASFTTIQRACMFPNAICGSSSGVKRVLFLTACLTLIGCHQDHRFESVCQIVRKQAVEQNDKGETEQVDVELEWDPCPGDQFQVVRGGKDFAACMAQYEVGEMVPVRVEHWWDNRGYYRWDVYQIGACDRTIEPDTEGSYEKSQECDDNQAFGYTNGFACSRRPFKDLVTVCPWMARN